MESIGNNESNTNGNKPLKAYRLYTNRKMYDPEVARYVNLSVIGQELVNNPDRKLLKQTLNEDGKWITEDVTNSRIISFMYKQLKDRLTSKSRVELAEVFNKLSAAIDSVDSKA